MLLIYDIETREVEGDFVTISDSEAMKPRIVAYSDMIHMPTTHKIEGIRAREYRYPNGSSALIGMSRKVWASLKLPLDCMSDQAEHIQSLFSDNNQLTRELNATKSKYEKLRNANFLQRLRHLFGINKDL